MSDYPEHDKLSIVSSKSQTIGEFLEWMGEDGIHLMRYVENHNIPVEDGRSITTILADYFQIDLDKIEEEKRQMLETIRELNKS